LSELEDRGTHLESNETERRAVVEQHDENDAARDVGQVHRFLLALMEQRAEIVLADQLRELVVGAEIGGGERGECRRVEVGPLAHGGHELAGSIDQERAAGVAVGQEPLQRGGDRAKVILGERPTCCANRHRVSVLGQESGLHAAKDALTAAT
jgi:hypothetical protein